LDSAVKFLFGASIDSLGAGLPYSHSSGLPNPTTFTMHSSNRFVNAFMGGLYDTSMRLVVGEEWPLYEPFKDKVLPNRRMLDSIVEPIVDEALRKHAEGKKLEDDEDDTLLRHLVSQTQDKALIIDEVRAIPNYVDIAHLRSIASQSSFGWTRHSKQHASGKDAKTDQTYRRLVH
jgi:hypothetical protein